MEGGGWATVKVSSYMSLSGWQQSIGPQTSALTQTSGICLLKPASKTHPIIDQLYSVNAGVSYSTYKNI